jgi:hypothetical protein
MRAKQIILILMSIADQPIKGMLSSTMKKLKMILALLLDTMF